MLNCKKTVEQLYAYLDRELSAGELAEVQDHLEQCPPCAKFFDFEAGMLRLVNDACKSVNAPATLKARILSVRSAAADSPPLN